MRVRNADGKSFSNDKENQYRGSTTNRGSRTSTARGNYQHQGGRSGGARYRIEFINIVAKRNRQLYF